jgi:hypothetical protein
MEAPTPPRLLNLAKPTLRDSLSFGTLHERDGLADRVQEAYSAEALLSNVPRTLVREPPACAEVTSEEREAPQSKPTWPESAVNVL